MRHQFFKYVKISHYAFIDVKEGEISEEKIKMMICIFKIFLKLIHVEDIIFSQRATIISTSYSLLKFA